MEILEWQGQREEVFLDRYALRDDQGGLLEHTPDEMWVRVAEEIANTPQEKVRFLDILDHWKFVPAGRILSGAGSKKSVSYYNCYVLNTFDSRKGIMKTVTDMIEISSRGGGVGVPWSILRPEGTYIKGVHGTSSGPMSWMTGADSLADSIRQGGTRTSALLWSLDIWHPDIGIFISRAERFKRANYSVAISHEFMKALDDGDDWDLIFPDTNHPKYDELWDGNIDGWRRKGLPVIVHATVSAQGIWDGLCENAIKTGNPGLLFLDRANYWSNTWYLDRLISTNPCGEQPLGPWGSCNLGSINLLAHVSSHNKEINRTMLANTIRSAVRFLDNVIDKSEPILEEIDEKQQRDRRIGLGTMGLADVLILRGIRYGSEECIEFIEDLYSFIRDVAYEASVLLAEEKGPAPGFDEPYYMRGHFIQTLPDELQRNISRHGIRNLHLLTQAPTGTTSIVAGASSGIEPIFMAEYTRTDATGCHVQKHPLFQGELSPAHVTAYDVDIEGHIGVQAAIQRNIDSAVSKTVNLNPTAKATDVDRAYRLADSSGCKGITVYRSKEGEGVCVACNI